MNNEMIYAVIALKKLIDRGHVKVDNEKDIPEILRIFSSLMQYYTDEMSLEDALKFTEKLLKDS